MTEELKTFQEIIEKWKKDFFKEWVIDNHEQGVVSNYIELLEERGRQEAIKWIKALKKGIDKSGYWEFDIDGLSLYGEPYEGHDALGMIIAFKHFFNISEEELQGGKTK